MHMGFIYAVVDSTYSGAWIPLTKSRYAQFVRVCECTHLCSKILWESCLILIGAIVTSSSVLFILSGFQTGLFPNSTWGFWGLNLGPTAFKIDALPVSYDLPLLLLKHVEIAGEAISFLGLQSSLMFLYYSQISYHWLPCTMRPGASSQSAFLLVSIFCITRDVGGAVG